MLIAWDGAAPINHRLYRRTPEGHPVWGQPVSDADRDRLARIRKAA